MTEESRCTELFSGLRCTWPEKGHYCNIHWKRAQNRVHVDAATTKVEENKCSWPHCDRKQEYTMSGLKWCEKHYKERKEVHDRVNKEQQDAKDAAKYGPQHVITYPKFNKEKHVVQEPEPVKYEMKQSDRCASCNVLPPTLPTPQIMPGQLLTSYSGYPNHTGWMAIAFPYTPGTGESHELQHLCPKCAASTQHHINYLSKYGTGYRR